MSFDRRPVIVIIGGGFVGAAVAYHLARALPAIEADILVVEPRERLGGGLAYSTDDPAHRINVPAAKLLLDTRDPLDFSRWIETTAAVANDPEARTPAGDVYPARAVFGDFVAQRMQPLLDAGRIGRRRETVTNVEATSDGYLVYTEGGARIFADRLVVAATHGAPALPPPLEPLRNDDRLVRDPFMPGTLQRIAANDRVLIVGTALTAADVIATLERRGHQGPITAISRHGLLSRPHADTPYEADDFDVPEWTHDAARPLLSAIRRTVRSAQAAGLPWQTVLDSVRRNGGAIWSRLPDSERQRLLRHLRVWWDVHRFRIAPQLDASIARLRQSGQLRLEAANIVDVEPGRPIEIALRPRGAAQAKWRSFDRVILATGPDHARLADNNPVFTALFREGLARPDIHRLGIATDRSSQAVGVDGRSTPNLFIAGPLARGTFGELMGIPEVTAQAEAVAAAVQQQISARLRRAS